MHREERFVALGGKRFSFITIGGLPNGCTEGVHTKIKLLKRISYGFLKPRGLCSVSSFAGGWFSNVLFCAS
uniref:Transposase IS204/IS1001/IS1096/IS1165 DDE domain-containing protein n=1 Tax=Ammonifex degensii TaxID=42838 RepID=A0A7C1F3J7_9THEO